jgi:tetratricopeptide (TPR) repeat protein
MTLVPALFFGILELGLRLFGYGYPTNYFVPTKIDGRTVYVENSQFGRRFFPPGLERTPTRFVLSTGKEPETYRIFVLGESAAQGFPDPAYNFARILEVMLRHDYPQTHFEIINTAMTAINSHVIVSIAQDCGEHQPDLFLVYAGNNEVVGPYGVANVLGTYCPSRGIIRASIFARSLRTGQLLTALGRVAQKKDSTPRAWGGMAMFLDSQVQESDPRLPSVYDHFRANLQDICHAGRANGAQVLVCTVATNLKDCPPFASLHGTSLTDEQAAEWDRAFAEGVRAESAGRPAEAIRSYEQAAALDADFAELQFRWGRCLAALGRHAEARERFEPARNLDTLRFRADTKINETIRAVAGGRAADGIYLVDAEQVLSQASPHGVPGEELFHEHVHMNFSGNYVLARAVHHELAAMLPESIRSRAAADAGPLSEQECAERLGLTDWNRLQTAVKVLEMMNTPPFTNQIDNAARTAHWQQQVRALRGKVKASGREPMIAIYSKAIRLADKDPILRGNYAALLQGFGDIDGAIQQWEIVLRLAPRDVRAHLDLATCLTRKGEFAAAQPHCSEGLRLAPEDPAAHLVIGQVRAAQGEFDQAQGKRDQAHEEFDQALAAYAEALRLNPLLADAHAAKGAVLDKQGKLDEAIDAYTEALRLRPDFAAAHKNLAYVLSRKERLDEAAHHASEAVRLEPEDPEAHLNLGNVLGKQGKVDAAIAEFTEALRLQPDFEAAQSNLAMVLEEAGRLDQAVAHLRKVLEAKPAAAVFRYRLALVLARQGKVDEAIAELEEVVRRQPRWTEAAQSLDRLRQRKAKGRN